MGELLYNTPTVTQQSHDHWRKEANQGWDFLPDL